MSSLSPQPLTRRSHVVELYSEAPLPTARGTFRVVVFRIGATSTSTSRW
jgi:hypothetical protein